MTIKILDISYYQDPSKINYDLVAGSVDGVILRAAYGTGVAGKFEGPDPQFDRHYFEFNKRDKPIGAYHFIVEYKPVAEQVQVMQDAIKGKGLRLGRWNDVEIESGAPILTSKTVIGYMTQAEAIMGEFGIYSSKYYWNQIMGTTHNPYSSRKLWNAYYGANISKYMPYGWLDWWLWQHTKDGSVLGYDRKVDLSHFYGTEIQFEDWTGESPTPPIPPEEEEMLFKAQVIVDALNVRSNPFKTDTNKISVAYKTDNPYPVYEVAGAWLRIGAGRWFCEASGNTKYVERIPIGDTPPDNSELIKSKAQNIARIASEIVGLTE